MKINFIADTHHILKNYRGYLIDALSKQNYLVRMFSLKEFKLIQLILTDVMIVSSNLRSNMFVLFFCGGMNIVIFNGLGRYRNSNIFRFLLITLMLFRNKNTYIFQNYADFRYIRRRAPGTMAAWICGSGGTQKAYNVEHANRIGVVSRSTKLELQAESILAFEKVMGQEVELVGVDDAGLLGRRTCHGHVKTNEIFLNINVLFLPDGYGEGFPHVACDALTSGMPCWMSNVNYVRYGLSKMGVVIVARRADFVCVSSLATGPNSTFSNEQIVDAYLRIITGITTKKQHLIL